MTNSCKGRRVWERVPWGHANSGLELDRAGHSTTAVGSILYIYGGRRGSYFHKDVLCFNTKTRCFEACVPECPFRARAHHSATLIGNRIWFVAGSDRKNIFNDVFVLDLSTKSWKQVPIQDPQELLTRCAHAADLHPRDRNTIVIMGGFGVPEVQSDPKADYETLNDVLLLHTDRCTVERIRIYGDPPPSPRAYHSLNFIGDKAYIFGGRVVQVLLSDRDPTMFCCLDILQSRWEYPMSNGSMVGNCPVARSSHQTVVYNGRLILHGGAVNPEGQDDRKERLNDMHTLVVKHGGKQLCWSTCDCPNTAADTPKARSAHEMALVGNTLYIMFGYAGSEQGQKTDMYARDCWKLQLLPDPIIPEDASRGRAAAKAGLTTTATVAVAAAVNAKQQTAGSKRSAGQRSREKSPGGGGASGVANNGAAAPSGQWRTAKRQRSGSGGLAGQQPCSQQQLQATDQAAQHQLQDHATAAPAAEAQPQVLQQPQLPAVSEQQPMQQPAHQQPPGRLCSNVDAQAAAAAAVWAVRQGQFVAGAERCCPPSPGYSGQIEYHRQQELDHLREQLQWQSSKTSSLEGENRQLKQQLQDLKLDKQHSDQLLQQLQSDCMRHKLSAEQAILRQQHEQEESQLLRQQLDALKQQLRKSESDAEHLRLQGQSLNADVTRLQGQVVVAGREKEQLQEQLKQQQEVMRAAEDKHAQERQTYQTTYANLAAGIEDYRTQTSKLNETIAEHKRLYEAEISKLRTEASSKDIALQDKVRQLLEVQQQLDSLRTALGDEQKKAERFQQLHSSAAADVQELQQKLQSLAGDRARLEAELGKVQAEHDRVKSDMEKKMASFNTAKAAVLQMQGLHQTVLNALS